MASLAEELLNLAYGDGSVTTSDVLDRMPARSTPPERWSSPFRDPKLDTYGFSPFPSLSPLLALPGAEARNYDPDRARPKDAMAPVSEMVSPTMGAYGLTHLLASMGREGYEGDWKGVADKLPLAMGIFAGAKAKTANLPALERAQSMAAHGAPREAIWNDTGWFRGPDKKWRFEIDDSGMKHVIPPVDWIPRKEDGMPRMAPNLETAYDIAASRLTPQAPVRVKRLFEHPELDQAYRYGFTDSQDHPGIMGMPVQLMKGGNSSGALIGRKIIGLHETLPPGEAKSALSHELQHAIGYHEGFAPGSSPERFAPDMLRSEAFTRNSERVQQLMDADPQAASVFRARNRYLAEMQTRHGQNWGQKATPDNFAALDKLESDLRQRTRNGRQLLELDWERAAQDAMPVEHWKGMALDRYHRMAGEVEARNVQKRLGMTPDERRAKPPWETQDVPDIQQLLGP